MSRPHIPTSHAAHEAIKPVKPNMFQIITDGIRKLKGGGTFDDISKVTGLRPEQVWKRLSELKRDGIIFDTGATRPLKSGLNGIVWQLWENVSKPVQKELF